MGWRVKGWAGLAQGKVVKKGKLEFQMHSHSQLRHPGNSKVGAITVISYLSLDWLVGIQISKEARK